MSPDKQTPDLGFCLFEPGGVTRRRHIRLSAECFWAPSPKSDSPVFRRNNNHHSLPTRKEYKGRGHFVQTPQNCTITYRTWYWALTHTHTHDRCWGLDSHLQNFVPGLWDGASDAWRLSASLATTLTLAALTIALSLHQS